MRSQIYVDLLREWLTPEQIHGALIAEVITAALEVGRARNQAVAADAVLGAAQALADACPGPPDERTRQVEERYDFTMPPALAPGDVTQALDAMAAEQDAGRPADGRPSIHNCLDGAVCPYRGTEACGLGPCKKQALLREQAG